ncbi:DNA internalization-related competence protein ComEC/Rec2 [Melioribacter sp. OK-6-Me]|uniref:DNA internalization-related competence protein ComEC/Rec2 n=1 Tax=unclassified Melioribacter TaxID=2627329 RepID=UPI003ED8BD7D
MNKYPLIKFTLFFICGIILESIINLPINIIIPPISLLFIVVLIQNIKRRSIYGNFFVVLLIIFVGALHFAFSSSEKVDYPFALPKYRNAILYGKICGIDLIKNDRLNFTVQVDSIRWNENVSKKNIKVSCAILLTMNDLRNIYDKIAVGNGVCLKGTLMKARDKRNPGEFDYQAYLFRRGISALFYVYKSDNIILTNEERILFPDMVFKIRRSIDDLLFKGHDFTTASLLRGLLLADRNMIDYEIKEKFINAGVIHILAVSGLHVGFIAFIFFVLFQRFHITLKYILTIFGLIAYLIITYAPPSVTRAVIMASVYIMAKYFGRDTSPLNTLAIAAFIILVFKPAELFEPGFQLSFAAVLSIVVLTPPISNAIAKHEFFKKRKWLGNLLLFMIVSLTAQIGTLPFTIIYFHKISLIALFANLIVIPLLGIVVSLGIVTLIFSVILPSLGMFYASATILFSHLMFYVTNFFGSIEIAYLRINQFSWYDLSLFYVTMIFVGVLFNYYKNKYFRAAVVILSIATMILFMKLDNYKYFTDNKLSIMAIDVGQGDAFLIRLPDGDYMLIDAGSSTNYFDNGKRIIIPLMDFLGIDSIKYGLISHIDNDHYGGFISLIKVGRVNYIFKPAVDSSDRLDVELEKLLRQKGIPFEYYKKKIIKFSNVRLYILNENNDDTILDSNDRSGIIKIVYGNTSFLFTGDASQKIESDLIKSYGKFLQSDVLKVAHHGSNTSTSEKFLKLVNPSYALISAGIGNYFNHPSPQVIALLKKMNVEVLRTDLRGAVLIRSDGENIEVIDWKKLESGLIF